MHILRSMFFFFFLTKSHAAIYLILFLIPTWVASVAPLSFFFFPSTPVSPGLVFNSAFCITGGGFL